MKKRSFKTLQLNKNSISNFSAPKIIGGGSGSCGACDYTTTDYTIPWTDLCATNKCQITTWCQA